MIKNKIEGVKPFNKFWLKSCYYHQLIAGLSALGVDRELFLLNAMVFAEEGFSADEGGILGAREFERTAGYRCKSRNISKRALKRRIDKGMPVIVGVDCFYLESRPEMFGIRHELHFLLCYGYDLKTREANVVDHAYRGSYEFREKVISLDNLLYANGMYRKRHPEKWFSCRVLRKAKVQKGALGLWSQMDLNRLLSSRKSSEKNLGELKRMFLSDLKELQEKSEKITDYLQSMRTSLYCLSETRAFSQSKEKSALLDFLISGYSNLLSLLWKMWRQENFSFAVTRRDGILRKIDSVKETEEKVYDCLWEACA
jgi:hypothetical protein